MFTDLDALIWPGRDGRYCRVCSMVGKPPELLVEEPGNMTRASWVRKRRTNLARHLLEAHPKTAARVYKAVLDTYLRKR